MKDEVITNVRKIDGTTANCVELLLGAGAKVDQAMNDSATPLFIAAQYGREVFGQLFFDSGADANICMTEASRHSPLTIAAYIRLSASSSWRTMWKRGRRKGRRTISHRERLRG